MVKMVMLIIIVDDGVQGFLFVFLEVVCLFVVNIFFCKVLVGQDLFNCECIWQDFNYWQCGSVYQLMECVLLFVEQVLWDLIGCSFKMLVYKLFGGYCDIVLVYGSIMCGDDLLGGLLILEEYVVFVEKLVVCGYKVIKLYIWMLLIFFVFNFKMDIKVCVVVCEVVGLDIDLMIDGYYWYSCVEVLWIGKELEKFNFVWFEELMEEDLMFFYVWLVENLLIFIVGLESFGGKYYMCVEWVKVGVCDILCVGVNGVGGIILIMKVVVLVEFFGMDCEVYGNGVVSLVVVGVICNCCWYECGLLYLFFDYDELVVYFNSIVDLMDDQGFVYLL